MHRILALCITCLLSLNAFSAPSVDSKVNWQSWSPTVFKQAARQNKYILLNMEAVWCHWCHVMDQKTYASPSVGAYLDKHYIAVKVDHDARPDLAERYRDYGWPATIFLQADGTEIVKRAGYIAPDNFLRLLKAIVKDPSPELAGSNKGGADNETKLRSSLDKQTRNELIERHISTHDDELGGLNIPQKFMERPHVEYALRVANSEKGTVATAAKKRARQTLDGAINLIDPAWGGVYQYSTHGDWQHLHYEKIMSSQTSYMRLYALAAQQFGDAKYLAASKDIWRYLKRFMWAPNGAFYTSQDADLVQGKHSDSYFKLSSQDRLKLGMPRIDKNQYTRENGWVIEALLNAYEADQNAEYLEASKAALKWVEENRSLPNSAGFKHDKVDVAGPYLGDSAAMVAAYMQLYKVTAEKKYLSKAHLTGLYIRKTFMHPSSGLLTAKADGSPVLPVRDTRQNIRVGRILNLLSHYTGDKRHKATAEHIMRYLSQRDIALASIEESGILLLDYELNALPAHYTVVGSKTDPTAQALYQVALMQAGWYERVEWFDVVEGRLMNHDVEFPNLDQAAGFVCTQGRCSLPSRKSTDYQNIINRLRKSPFD